MGISAKVLDSTPAPILVSVLALLSVQGNIGYRRFLPVRCNSFLASYRGLPTVRLSQMRSFRNVSSGLSFGDLGCFVEILLLHGLDQRAV